MSRARGSIALLIPGSIKSQKGGSAMRWRALCQALGGPKHCFVIELTCNHFDRCNDLCAVSGGIPPNPEAADSYYTRLYCDHLARRIAEQLAVLGISLVVCSGLEAHRYAISMAKFAGLRVIYDMHNVELPLFRSLKAEGAYGLSDADVQLIGRGEESAILSSAQVWVCSASDARLLCATYPSVDPASVHVVPNAVAVRARPRLPSVSPRGVCFTGHLRWHPNVDAIGRLANGIVPALRERGFEGRVVVAGAEPDEEMIELCRAAGVDVIADPESTAELIANNIVTVPLMLGGGTRFKALEAFASGAPLISTGKGVEGLEAEPGSHYVEAESYEEFAAGIIRLTANRHFRDSLVLNAWSFVRSRYSTEVLRSTVRRALSEFLAEHRATAGDGLSVPQRTQQQPCRP